MKIIPYLHPYGSIKHVRLKGYRIALQGLGLKNRGLKLKHIEGEGWFILTYTKGGGNFDVHRVLN